MDFARTIRESTLLMLQGLEATVLVSLISIAIGIVIGFFSCMLGRARLWLLRGISGVYIWIIRGTPMIVQVLVIYFGLPQLLSRFFPGFRITALTASIITLSLNAGAYLSEIFRGGISAVDGGQVEAARSLGLSSARTMFRVILPQAIRVASPSMINQFIITIKDSSILSVIGLAELVNKAKVYVGASYQFFATYILLGAYYLAFISILMVISRYVEKRFNYERRIENKRD